MFNLTKRIDNTSNYIKLRDFFLIKIMKIFNNTKTYKVTSIKLQIHCRIKAKSKGCDGSIPILQLALLNSSKPLIFP